MALPKLSPRGVAERSAPGKPAAAQTVSILERFPLDVQRAILDYVPRKDLPNLARVKAISFAARLHLYRTVQLRVAQHEGFVRDLDYFLKAGKENLAMVENISILNSTRRQCSRSIGHSWNRDGSWKEREEYMENVNEFNDKILIILRYSRNLQSVRWFHTFKMKQSTFSMIIALSTRTLTNIETHGLIIDDHPPSTPLSGLPDIPRLKISLHTAATTRHCGVLTPELTSIFTQQASNITHLVIGNESDIIRTANSWIATRNIPPDRTPIYQLLQPRGASIAEFRNVQKLGLIGLRVIPLLNPPDPVILRPALDLYRLHSLSLDSCVGIETLLGGLSRSARDSDRPYAQTRLKLKEFRVRAENPSQTIKTALERFLASFKGLKLLSVLLDGTDEMIDHATVMAAHGGTLKVLVWEGRRSLRSNHIDLEHSIDGTPAFLTLLSETCPNIEELSVVLNMRTLYLRNQGRLYCPCPYMMLQLPRLKTLHCRDFLVPNSRSLLPEYAIHANRMVATSFLDWGTHAHFGLSKLELLAVGPINFHDRWVQNHHSHDYSVHPERGPIFYDVRTMQDNLMDIAHCLNPLVKVRARTNDIVPNDVEEIKREYRHTRVFESYWLR
ncbi:hypothetical protein FQN52_009054 [Onygenales sp. PD_12]|nr:hypothetical protein FQN53_000297 [Emmonsiellopsis sp. PD_33]KAK2784367.1 hypothetical protein FQN52_009054 [Onygenales sp. PD_12]